MKEQIAADYMEQMKQRHAHKLSRLSNRRAIVTGSNTKDNIGAEIARELRALGISVTEPDTEGYRLDDPSDVQRLDHDADFHSTDILVMSQGYIYMDWMENVPPAEIVKIVNSNLTSVALMGRQWAASTIDNPWRKYMVVIGSMAYRNVLNGSAVYAAAKAGVAHYVKCLSWELAPKGFRVFAVHPGNTQETPMARKVIQHIARYRGLTIKQAADYWHAVEPTGELLYPLHVANTVRWLVSEDADHLTGTSFDLSSGVR